MDENIKDQDQPAKVRWKELSEDEKRKRRNNSEAGINARKKHAEKRISRNISLNKDNAIDQVIIEVFDSKKFSFSAWFRHIFQSYTHSEKGLLKNGHYILPSMLVEKAIEDGDFDLDAYLESKGKKIVKIEETRLETEYFD